MRLCCPTWTTSPCPPTWRKPTRLWSGSTNPFAATPHCNHSLRCSVPAVVFAFIFAFFCFVFCFSFFVFASVFCFCFVPRRIRAADWYIGPTHRIWTRFEHDLNTIWTRFEHDLNTIWTRSEHDLNTIWTRLWASRSIRRRFFAVA